MGVTAAAAGFQPDLMVKLASEPDGSYLGQGVYEATAASQSKSQPAFPGTSAAYRVLFKNAGDGPDSFLLRGTAATGCTVSFLDEAGNDRSAAFLGAGYATGTLAPGASLSFLVQVSPAVFTPGASFRVAVTAASAGNPASTDQVKTETVACSAAAAVTVSAPPGGSGNPGTVVSYPFTVTNVGGAVNSFALSVATGNGWSSALYAGNQQTSSSGPLAPGASYSFLVAVTVPSGSPDGAHADSRLAVTGDGTSASQQVTTTASAANLTVSEGVRNVSRGAPFQSSADASPSETLEYRMTVSNSGSAPATGVAIDAPLPLNSSCVTGSLWIGTGSGGDGAPCAADDCGVVRESAGSVAARPGQGASDSAGGALAPGKTLYVYYRVLVQ